MSEPLLSLCISTYNRARRLAQSLEAALRETAAFADVVELLVVDNASTDGTPKVVEGFGDAANLRSVRNPANVGLLGNLRVCAEAARGEYLWIIGDDDLLLPGTVERVLQGIVRLRGIELIYLNYAHGGTSGVEPVSTRFGDVHADAVRYIAGYSENCFTAVYCCVFARDAGRAAYSMDTSGEPFSTLAACAPSAEHVMAALFDRPALWLGAPALVADLDVSWGAHAHLFVLERLPELFDRMEAGGTPRADLELIRAKSVPRVLHFLEAVLSGERSARGVDVERVIRRFKHIDAFASRLPGILARTKA
jgi:glycosyltransferase involved in cell wall biosynthesis